MTSKQQRYFYFPAWNQAALAHGWTLVKGRLTGRRQESWAHAEPAELYQRVWEAAYNLARAAHRAVTPEDLRHACHVVALGKDKSSTDMDNQETDRVVTLFRILADPDDLDAILAWTNPENSERKRYVASIRRRADFKYIDKLCRDKFSGIYITPFYEDLPMPQLKQLYLTIRARFPQDPSPAPEQKHPKPINLANQPF